MNEIGSIGLKVSMSHPSDLNAVLDLGATLVNSYQHPGYGNNLQWYLFFTAQYNAFANKI